MTLKTALLVLGGVTLVAGLVVGIILVSQQQLIGKKAAVTVGQATFKLSPESQTFGVGEEVTISGVLNTGAAQISGFQILGEFTYSDASSPITVVGNEVVMTAPFFTTEAKGSCPARTVTENTATKTFTISATCIINDNQVPYSTAGVDVTIFTMRLRGNAVGSINISFDQIFSKVTLISNNEDVLTVPTSATYTVSSTTTSPTPSLTPTPATGGATPTPSLTPTPTTTGNNQTNSCGGTCGSNDNCNSDLFCYQGYCRKAACPSDATCGCTNPTPTTSTSDTSGNTDTSGDDELMASGSTSSLILGGAGIILIFAAALLMF